MVTPGTPGKIITAVPKLAAGAAQQGVTQVTSFLTPRLSFPSLKIIPYGDVY